MAMLGVLCLVVFIVIMVCWFKKRHSRKNDWEISPAESSKAYIALEPAVTTVDAEPRRSTRLVNVICIQDVIDVGEGILSMRQGSTATCTPQDWASIESEWCWVSSASGSGWVPREFLRIV